MENVRFLNFYKPYIYSFQELVKSKLKKNNANCLFEIENFEKLLQNLYSNLFKFSIRVLIRELHYLKNNGELQGESPEGRFNDFEKKVETVEFKEYLWKKYPVLEMIIERYIVQTSDYVVEIILNFEKNKENLEENFQIKLSSITDISLGSGDTHKHGRTVAIVYFKNRKLVYKPHSLKPDIIFENILKWVYKQEGVLCKYHFPKIKSYDNYGWQEFIDYTTCETLDEVKNYYFNAGVLLAIFYTLGSTDMHFENLIAVKDTPTIIDLETLVGTNRYNKMHTVLDSGLIPQMNPNHLFDIDLSGLCGKKDKSEKIKTLTLINSWTDNMYVEEGFAQIKTMNNQVSFRGKEVKVEDYIDILLKGYIQTINCIVNSKEEYIHLILTLISDNDKFRTVLRNTQVYAKFLSASLHPDYLVNSEKQYELFNRLLLNCKDQNEILRVQDEINSLLDGDVPYYIIHFNSNNLYSVNGVVKEKYFVETPKELICENVRNVDKNLSANIHLIEKSLFLAYSDKSNTKTPISINTFKSKCEYKNIFEIANRISENIFKVDDKVIYYINTIKNYKSHLRPINIDLYEGGGIIFFLYMVGEVYGKNEYRNDALKLGEFALNYFEMFEFNDISNTSNSLNIFSGYGSLLYISSILYFQTKNDKWKNIFETALEKIDKFFDSFNFSQSIGILDSIAGIAVVLSNILLKERSPLIEKLYDKCAKELEKVTQTQSINKVGLGHGISGIAYALCKMYKVSKNQDYLCTAEKLLLEEDVLFSNSKSRKVSWCNGAAGCCVSRSEFLAHNESAVIRKSLEAHYKALESDGVFMMNNMCLCHGLFGNIEVMLELNRRTDRLDFGVSNEILDEYIGSVYEHVDDIGLGYIKKFQPDTFMNGISGIGYFFLRHIYPHLPSILFLDV